MGPVLAASNPTDPPNSGRGWPGLALSTARAYGCRVRSTLREHPPCTGRQRRQSVPSVLISSYSDVGKARLTVGPLRPGARRHHVLRLQVPHVPHLGETIDASPVAPSYHRYGTRAVRVVVSA